MSIFKIRKTVQNNAANAQPADQQTKVQKIADAIAVYVAMAPLVDIVRNVTASFNEDASNGHYQKALQDALEAKKPCIFGSIRPIETTVKADGDGQFVRVRVAIGACSSGFEISEHGNGRLFSDDGHIIFGNMMKGIEDCRKSFQEAIDRAYQDMKEEWGGM